MKDTNKYLEEFLEPVRVSSRYMPKFGNSKKINGYNYEEFNELYSSDPFYSWLGLNSKLMYSAHKAAGGMTSIYRQIGIGCEKLFRLIIQDSCQYDDAKFSTWSYTTETRAGKKKKLSLDGRLELDEIRNLEVLKNVQDWIQKYSQELEISNVPTKGVVFEVRQGYKSKDSKRQNADIDNATVAWANGYLPVFAIFSSQIDTDIILRYRNSRCGIITGVLSDRETLSIYAFCAKVLGFDLANFFQTNEDVIKAEILSILEKLLSADGTT